MSKKQVSQLFWRLLSAFQERFWYCVIQCSKILLHLVEILKQSGQSTVLSLSINLFLLLFNITKGRSTRNTMAWWSKFLSKHKKRKRNSTVLLKVCLSLWEHQGAGAWYLLEFIPNRILSGNGQSRSKASLPYFRWLSRRGGEKWMMIWWWQRLPSWSTGGIAFKRPTFLYCCLSCLHICTLHCKLISELKEKHYFMFILKLKWKNKLLRNLRL